MKILLANCPLCCEGHFMNPNTGDFVPCRTCHGTGKLTPNNICVCGLSVNTIEDGIMTCGDPECLKNSKHPPYSGAYDARFPRHF